MRERPILFSAPMVRAIISGAKSQTRRLVKPQPPDGHTWAGWCVSSTHRADEGKSTWAAGNGPYLSNAHRVACPYGQPGDRLWVRESWSPDPPDVDGWGYAAWAGCREGQIAGVPERFRHPRFCNYAADWLHGPIRWTPSIHMPRWASRITLEVTGVRVERLQDISDADALAEGVDRTNTSISGYAKERYRNLWESINGEGAWSLNPWVWVVSFHRMEGENGRS